MMETLLIALVNVPVLPTGKELVNSLLPMLEKLERETDECVSAFRLSLKGDSAMSKLLGRFQHDAKPPVSGCYFCSSPYSPKGFKKVHIRLGEQALRVYGCEVCRAAIKRHGAVDVLFFEKNKENIHWSDAEDYDPKQIFG